MQVVCMPNVKVAENGAGRPPSAGSLQLYTRSTTSLAHVSLDSCMLEEVQYGVPDVGKGSQKF